MSKSAFISLCDSPKIHSSISEFYKSYDSKKESETFGGGELSSNTLNWKMPLVPKLSEEHANAHYLCPRCRHFPLIEFISKDYVYYTCECEDRKKKLVQVKQLFNKDNQYITFWEHNSLKTSDSDDEKVNKGFKCTEEHYFEKIQSFQFYCTKCFVNICEECVGKHRDDKDKFHPMIILIFEYFNNYDKIKIINDIMNGEDYKNNTENSSETNKIIILDDKAFVNENQKNEFDYFAEYINIIFNDYLHFSNYIHTYNIDNIYKYFKSEHFGVKIKYINQKNENTKLFGKNFVKNHQSQLSIIIGDSIEYIKEKHRFEPNNNIVEVYLTNKNINNTYSDVLYLSDMFKDCISVYEIEFDNKGFNHTSNLTSLFEGCTYLKEIQGLTDLVDINTIYLKNMFRNCSSLEALPDISKWNTSSVTAMEGLFEGCESLKSLPDISNWNTEKVENMSNMFRNCKSLKVLPDISYRKLPFKSDMKEESFKYDKSFISEEVTSYWNTRNVKDMSYMFSGCTNLKELPDISNWNIGNVINMEKMFSGCSNLIDIPYLSSWDTNKAENISGMFKKCSKLKYLSFLANWKTDKIRDMSELFYGCSNLIIPDLTSWKIIYRTKTLNTTDMYRIKLAPGQT